MGIERIMYKNILPIVDLDIIVVIVLFIVLILYKRRFGMKRSINKIYINIVILTIFIIILEVLDKFILLSNSNFMVPITKGINVLGFGMAPIISYLWKKYLLENFNITRKLYLEKVLIFFNIIISVLSYNYGYIFIIENNNTYERGQLFLIPMIVTYIFFITSLFNIYINKHKIDEKEFIILMLCGILPMLAAIIQIFYNNLLLIWGSVGISIIIHYIYLQEGLLKYDNLTGVLNRMTFESYFYNKFINKRNDFSLIYIDVNDFKNINDNYGHNEGDIALINIAETLKRCFSKDGKVGRLGGDEFIIITDICNRVELENKIDSIELEINNLNNRMNKSYDLEISLGYKEFHSEYFSLGDYIKEIDELMYLDKKRKKCKVSS